MAQEQLHQWRCSSTYQSDERIKSRPILRKVLLRHHQVTTEYINGNEEVVSEGFERANAS